MYKQGAQRKNEELLLDFEGFLIFFFPQGEGTFHPESNSSVQLLVKFYIKNKESCDKKCWLFNASSDYL